VKMEKCCIHEKVLFQQETAIIQKIAMKLTPSSRAITTVTLDINII